MKYLNLVLILNITFILIPPGYAQNYEQTIIDLTKENDALREEINILKNRVRLLESQVGSNSIRSTYSGKHPQSKEKNDLIAKKTLTEMSRAAEKYAKENYGSYPVSVSLMLEATPPYLNINYCDETMAGYIFKCETFINEYRFTATPVELDVTGSTIYTISTGGILEF